MGSMWGGRFADKPSALFEKINNSLAYDWALVAHDITASIAWSKALGSANVLTTDECDRLVSALDELREKVQHINEPPTESGAEDVHSWIESQLVESLGDLGKKLHTGRSRNDQVATDLRLWTKEAMHARVDEVRTLQRALLNLAQREINTVMPGYTHLQPAQPVLLAHWAMAFFHMLDRDAAGFARAVQLADTCPLGSAALTGTAYPIDRTQLAHDLGFAAPTANSLDAVSDRDFVLEALFAASRCSVHLAKLAEECVIFSSHSFGFFAFADSVTSGSSIMPQKKNPDAMELVRGKSGRIIGDLTAMLITLKGLPLAYNKDLQEDKESLFDAQTNLSTCLQIAALSIDTLEVNRHKTHKAAIEGYTNATELADYLVSKGVPFRDAHASVGKIVRLAISSDRRLEQLPIEMLQSVAPQIEQDVYGWLTLESCLARRDVIGGTAPTRVQHAIHEAMLALDDEKSEHCNLPNAAYAP